MMADSRCGNQHHGDVVDLFPSKKKSGVLQKTREAIGIVNSKLKHGSRMRYGDAVEMMPFESTSSFGFNPGEDVSNVGDPFKSDNAEKSQAITNNATDECRRNEDPNIVKKGGDDQEEMIDAPIENPKTSPQKKSARNLGRHSKMQHPSTSSHPRRSKSGGNVTLKSKHKSFAAPSNAPNKPSSARVRRHLSVPVPTQQPDPASPAFRRKRLSTPVHAQKHAVEKKDFPNTPSLTPETEPEDLSHTPIKEAAIGDTSWKRISRAYEENDGATGGYFAKLVEKMEGDGAAPGYVNGQADEEDEKDDQKKSSKFKTPRNFRKLFSMGRSTRGDITSKDHDIVNSDEGVSDMAMFTAFISSPKAVDSPQRSDIKRISHTHDDDSDSISGGNPNISSEKGNSLDDIRNEINSKNLHANIGQGQQDLRHNPKKAHPRSPKRRSSMEHGGKELPDTKHVRGEGIKDPGSPLNRRGGKRSSLESQSNLVDKDIPRHSLSNRQTRTNRTKEKPTVNDQLSRSAHRHRRPKGSTSKESWDKPTKPDSRMDLDEALAALGCDKNENQERPPSRRNFTSSIEPNEDPHSTISDVKASPSIEKSKSTSRKKSSSKGKIDTRGLGSHSSHGRRKRVSDPRRSDRPHTVNSDADLAQKVVESREENGVTKHSPASDSEPLERNSSLLAQCLGSEPPSPSISRRSRTQHNQRQALLMRSTSLSNVNKGSVSRDSRRPHSVRLNRQGSEGKLGCVSESKECSSSSEDEDNLSVNGSHVDEPSPVIDHKKRLPSLAESLERGSDLNIRLFDGDGQETVMTDDGSLWLDQGSLSGLEIKSSASVAAPQLVFDKKLSRIVDHS